MIWLLGLLGIIATVFLGLYRVGPGLNKKQKEKSRKEWIRQWNDLFKKK